MSVTVLGESGAVLTFTGPLPPVIQARLERGELRRVTEPVSAPSPGQAPGVSRPGVRASRARWQAHAVSQGMPAGEAARMTKTALVKRYTRLRAVS